MSFTLFKMGFKKNWILLLIFFSVLSMYLFIMVSMYDPEEMESLNSMLELFPEDLMNAMGFNNAITDLTSYLASWLYGLLMFGFPMVYCIILGNRLVAKMVDNSSIVYLLSTPNSRFKVVFTQGIYALTTVVLLFAALFGVGVLSCSIVFPGLLDVSAFLKLNLTTMLVNSVVMMISFFFSCLFNESRTSLSFGAGVPVAFLLTNMLGGTSEDVEFLKGFSIYGLYDPVELVGGADILWVNLIYVALVIVLFAASLLVFSKKRLPI